MEPIKPTQYSDSKYKGAVSSLLQRFKSSNNKFSPRKLVGLIVFLLIIGSLIYFVTQKSTNKTLDSQNKTDSDQVQLPDPTSTVTLNKEFSFPVKNDKGVEITKLKFTVQDAEVNNEIVVKGQKATAIQGRTFLILNLKIVNESDKSLDINTRDYIRLIVNDNTAELLAPDIHNDPVNVQAIATKYTRLAFPINVNDKNLKLQVGEISGEKTSVDLNLDLSK